MEKHNYCNLCRLLQGCQADFNAANDFTLVSFTGIIRTLRGELALIREAPLVENYWLTREGCEKGKQEKCERKRKQ